MKHVTGLKVIVSSDNFSSVFPKMPSCLCQCVLVILILIRPLLCGRHYRGSRPACQSLGPLAASACSAFVMTLVCVVWRWWLAFRFWGEHCPRPQAPNPPPVPRPSPRTCASPAPPLPHQILAVSTLSLFSWLFAWVFTFNMGDISRTDATLRAGLAER